MIKQGNTLVIKPLPKSACSRPLQTEQYCAIIYAYSIHYQLVYINPDISSFSLISYLYRRYYSSSKR